MGNPVIEQPRLRSVNNQKCLKIANPIRFTMGNPVIEQPRLRSVNRQKCLKIANPTRLTMGTPILEQLRWKSANEGLSPDQQHCEDYQSVKSIR